MKTILVLTLLCYAVVTYAEIPNHDPTLDIIANNIAVLDSDINAWMSLGSTGVKIGDLNTNSLGSSNSVVGSFRGSTNQMAGFAGSGSNAIAGRMGSFAVTNQNMVGGNYQTLSSADTLFVPFGTIAGRELGAHLGGDAFAPSYVGVSAPTIDKGTDWAAFKLYVRLGITIVMNIFFFLAALDFVRNFIAEYLGQRQTQGTSQAILGTSASLPSGLAYAAVITALLATLIGFLFLQGFVGAVYGTSFTDMHTLLSALANGGSYVGQHAPTYSPQVWAFISGFFPFSALVITFCNYIAFRYIYAIPLLVFVRSVILYFIV